MLSGMCWKSVGREIDWFGEFGCLSLFETLCSGLGGIEVPFLFIYKVFQFFLE